MSSEIVSFCMILPDAPICIRCSGLLVGPRTKCNSGVFGFFVAFLLHYSTLFSEDSVLSFEFLCCSCDRQTEKEKTMPAPTKKDVLHVVKKNHYPIFTTMSQNQTDTILFAKIVKS